MNIKVMFNANWVHHVGFDKLGQPFPSFGNGVINLCEPLVVKSFP
jgi:hypothetical protein